MSNVFSKVHGTLLRITCPFCEEQADYQLIKNQPALFLLSWFNIGITWSLRCGGCGHEVDVEDDEVNRAKQVVNATQLRAEERMNEETYANRLNTCRLRVLDELHARNLHWTCPECEAEVPLTFHDCWQCKTRNPEAPESVEGEEAPPTELPMLIIHDPLDGTKIFSNSRRS